MEDFDTVDAEVMVRMLFSGLEEKMDWLQDSVLSSIAESEGLDLNNLTPPLTITKESTIQEAMGVVATFLEVGDWDKEFIVRLVGSLMFTAWVLDNKMVDGIDANG